MTLTQEQIEHLRTIQETSSFWADVAENQLPALADKIDNIDLTPIENKVDEGVSTLSTKIDNIDLSSVAKQGDNQEATNSAIFNTVNSINADAIANALMSRLILPMSFSGIRFQEGNYQGNSFLEAFANSENIVEIVDDSAITAPVFTGISNLRKLELNAILEFPAGYPKSSAPSLLQFRSKTSLLAYAHDNFPNTVESVIMDNLETLKQGSSGNGGGLFHSNYANLKVVEIPKLKGLGRWVEGVFYGATTNNLERLYLGTYVHFAHNSTSDLDGLKGFTTPSLLDVEVPLGHNEKINIPQWNPTIVFEDAEKTSQLISNIREHILNKIKDVSEETALTFTISTNMYDTITTIDTTLAQDFLDKGWILAGG